MMKILIALSISLSHLAVLGVSLSENCDGIVFNYQCHNVELLISNVNAPSSLIVDYTTKDLYFSYHGSSEEFHRVTSRLNLNTGRYDTIDKVPDGFAHAIDRKTGDVYLGGCNGIYKLLGLTHRDNADFYAANNSCIQSLFFRNVLFYSDFPSLKVYIARDLVKDKIFEDLKDTTVYDLVIDNKKVMFYHNDTGFYRQQLGKKTDTAKLISDYYSGIICLTLDIKSDVYACISDGIYKVDKKALRLERIAKLHEPFGLAFDSDNNVILSFATQVVLLTPKSTNTKIVSPSGTTKFEYV